MEVEESNEASSRWLVINSVQLMEDFIVSDSIAGSTV